MNRVFTILALFAFVIGTILLIVSSGADALKQPHFWTLAGLSCYVASVL